MRTTIALRQEDNIYRSEAKKRAEDLWPKTLGERGMLTGSVTAGLPNPEAYITMAHGFESFSAPRPSYTISRIENETLEESRQYLEKELKNQRFEKLAQEWKKETRVFSSSDKIINHPAYLEIIKMGFDVVPLILRDLENEPHHWFRALSKITKFDPVPPTDRGKIKKMAEHWLNWAKQHGYEW